MIEYTLDEFMQKVRELMCMTQDEVDKDIMERVGKGYNLDKVSYIITMFKIEVIDYFMRNGTSDIKEIPKGILELEIGGKFQ